MGLLCTEKVGVYTREREMTRERERESERVRKEVKVRDENLLPR